MSKTYLKTDAAFLNFTLASPLWPGGDQRKTSYGLILHFRSHLIWERKRRFFQDKKDKENSHFFILNKYFLSFEH